MSQSPDQVRAAVRRGGASVAAYVHLLQLAVHLAYHLGQVSYHRRVVTGDVRGVGALSAAELVAGA